MPFKMNVTALGEQVEYDSGDYPLLLDKALARFGWADLQSELRKRRANGEHVGAGMSMFVEKSGLGPADGVAVSVDTSGTVEVVTGGASVGQGIETVVAQITADALGIDYRRVRVIHGQTDRIAYGIGAHASRATVMTGSAAYNAALNLRAKALAIAGRLMQIKPDELDVVDGTVIPKGRPSGPSMSLAEVARHAAPGSPALGGELEPGLSATGWHHTSHMAYPYGIHMAAVRVDRGTGRVDVERYLIAYDIGRAVNPMLVRGQVVGGFAQGLGGALYEEFLYNERGEPLSVTFADYLIPTAREVPVIDVLITEDAPSPLNPLGLKGTGEAGVNGVGAAIAAAVDDAIGMPGAVTQLPITPGQLHELLRRK
jgi:carbon-monoxide dehydrogenase large subunit/6-hydroxypseudooxynicotine dehydrogenase subunit gamma